jgi:predicted TIM-barrel fold metal-dependent hydrolase
VRGVRLFTTITPEPTWLDEPSTYPVWEMAEALKIPVCVQMQMRQLPCLERMVQRFPKVTVALDHWASLYLDRRPLAESAPELFGLAQYPNLYLKFSTLNLDMPQLRGNALKPFVQELLARFGPQRLMWGSNFPATYDRPYKRLVQYAQESLAFLSAGDRRWVFGATAAALWPALATGRTPH